VTWLAGRKPGILMSLVSIFAWFTIDQIGGHIYFHPAIPYWNAGARLIVFIIIVLLLSRLSVALDQSKAASRLKTEMLSLVSHQFNNTLAVMSMTLGMLREQEGNRVSEQQEQFYLTLERVHNTLKQAITNFLNHTRMESGRFALDIRKTNLRNMVDESFNVLAPLCKLKGLHIELDHPPDTITVRVDPDAVALVMNNLISNAIKYTRPGGNVKIRIVPSEPTPGQVLISVEDDGVGISEEDVNKIFSGFYRTEEAKKTALGYGLGLKISRDIIESHGTRLDVESAPGKGSRFFFCLPIWEG